MMMPSAFYSRRDIMTLKFPFIAFEDPLNSTRTQGPEERSSSRTELVFLAKDNRHNLLRTCVTRVTYIFTAIRRDVRLSLQIILDWSATDFVNDVLFKNVVSIFDTVVFFLYLNTFS